MPSQVEGRTYPAEAELIRQAVRKDETAIRAIIQQHNRRLYRVARSIMRDDADAEDVLQEAYLHAFSALAEFRGEAALSTWLTRIVVNEALQRLRRPTGSCGADRRGRTPGAQVIPFPTSAQQSDDPERAMAQREICQLVEHAIDELPQEFRTVLVARVIEGMSVEETADAARPAAGNGEDAAASRAAAAQGGAGRAHGTVVQRRLPLRRQALRAHRRCRCTASQLIQLRPGTSGARLHPIFREPGSRAAPAPMEELICVLRPRAASLRR